MKLASLRTLHALRALLAPIAPIAAFAAVAGASLPARAAEPAPETQAPAPEPDTNNARKEMTSGFMLGASVNYAAPVLLPIYTSPNPQAGPVLGVSAGYRAHFLYVGATYEHGFFGGGSIEHESTTVISTGSRSDYVGVDLITFSNPDSRVAFFTHVGAGFRSFSSDTYIYAPPAQTFTQSGWDIRPIGLGVEIRCDHWLRIVPEAGLTLGAVSAIASIGVTTYFDLGTPGSSGRASASSSTAGATAVASSASTTASRAPEEAPALPSRDYVAPYSGGASAGRGGR